MKKVLMIIDTSRLTGRDLLRGAEQYVSAFAQWEVHTLDPNYLTGNFSREFQKLDLGKFDGFFVCYTKNISLILKTKNRPLHPRRNARWHKPHRHPFFKNWRARSRVFYFTGL